MTTEKLQIQTIPNEILEGADIYIIVGEFNFKLAVLNSNKNYFSPFEFTINHTAGIDKLFPFKLADLQSCRKVIIGITLPQFVIIPASFFDTKAAIEYLQQAFEIDRSIRVRYKLIRSMNAFMVYQHSNFITELIGHFAKTEVIVPEIDAFVQFINQKLDNFDFVLNFHNRSFTIYLMKDSKIQHIQHCTFVEASDAVFYILGILKRFKIDPVTAKALLSGNIMPYSELYNTLYRFIGELEWFTAPMSPLNINSDTSENSHTIADLHCLALCV